MLGIRQGGNRKKKKIRTKREKERKKCINIVEQQCKPFGEITEEIDREREAQYCNASSFL